MNNSHITPAVQKDSAREKTQIHEASLLRQIAAIREIRESSSWSTLKIERFDSLVQTLERELRDEAKRSDPNTNKLNRLAGEIKWAEQFSDLEKFEKALMVELQMVRIRLHENKD